MANNKYAQKTYGVGTIYVNLYNIKFIGYNDFENNLGITAIHIINGIIDMSLSSGNFFQEFWYTRRSNNSSYWRVFINSWSK